MPFAKPRLLFLQVPDDLIGQGDIHSPLALEQITVMLAHEAFTHAQVSIYLSLAAVKADGSAVTWGHRCGGGDSSQGSHTKRVKLVWEKLKKLPPQQINNLDSFSLRNSYICERLPRWCRWDWEDEQKDEARGGGKDEEEKMRRR